MISAAPTTIGDAPDVPPRELRNRLARFQLRGAAVDRAAATLSGGERFRVALAGLLLADPPPQLLVLDEPTNDLDMETLRALEDALEDYAGCAVIISHDRWFLNRIATHILAFEGDSHVEWFEGNFSDYEADKVRRLGADSGTVARTCSKVPASMFTT